MRPKRKVVVLASSEVAESVLRIVLETHGYSVWLAVSEQDMRLRAKQADVCLLVGCGAKDQERIERRMHRAGRRCARIFVGECDLRGEGTSVAAMLKKIKIACIRKRGPRTGAKYSQAVESARGEMRREKLAREKWRAA